MPDVQRTVFACLRTYRTCLLLTLALAAGMPAFAGQGIDPAIELRAAARLELATAYYTQHQYGAALGEVNQALSLYPSYVQAFNMLGLVQIALNHPADADQAFQKALSLDANDGDTHNNYGWFLCQNRQASAAFPHFEAAANNPMYQTPERAYYNAGRCARNTGDRTKAFQYLTTALRAQPKATIIMYELADLQYAEHNYQAVLDVLEKIDAVQGPTPQALWLALRAERQLGHANEVESYGVQLLRKFPDSAEAVLYRAKSFD